MQCKCCSKRTEPHLCLTCCICKSIYYHGCVNMSSSETRTINSKKSLSWTCSKCEDIGGDINSLRAAIIALQDEVKELKAAKNIGNVANIDFNFEEIVREVNDRNSRRCNLVIFGINEQSSNVSKVDRNSVDKNDVARIFSYISNTVPTDEIQCLRLGRFTPENTRPRPIKVTLRNENDVHEILVKSKKLRESDNFKYVYINQDRTPREMDYFRKIKEELVERRQKGENVKIKHVNGVPRIVVNLN